MTKWMIVKRFNEELWYFVGRIRKDGTTGTFKITWSKDKNKAQSFNSVYLARTYAERHLNKHGQIQFESGSSILWTEMKVYATVGQDVYGM